MHDPNAELHNLLQPHLTRLYRLAYRLCGSQPDAEDLVQDVLVKVCTRAEELTSIRDLSPWLSRVLYNQFIDDRRRYGRMPLKLVDAAVDEEQLDEPSAGPERQASLAEDSKRLSIALQKLPEEQRVVLLLHDAEGYKLVEIAELAGTPVGTLKSRLHRARERLAQLMKIDGTFSAPQTCKGLEGAKLDAL